MIEEVKYWIVGGIVLFLAIAVGCYIAIATEQRAWEDFLVAHQCRVVSKSKDSTTIGIGTNGTTIIVTPVPGVTGYLCDDGITYYR